MIIDYHTHIFRKEDVPNDAEECNTKVTGSTVPMHIEPEQHWEAMKDVDKALVFGSKSIAMGYHSSNDYIGEYVSSHSEKLIGVATVDPHDPKCMDEVEHCYSDLGFKGIKLSPIIQNFNPMDPRAIWIYKFAEKHGLFIIFHSATHFLSHLPLRLSHPELLEDVAVAFPDMVMLIAHIAHPWDRECISLIRKHPNVYTDVSGISFRKWFLYNALALAQDYQVLHKILFGTDWPFLTVNQTIKDLKSINNIVEGTNLPKIPDEEIKKSQIEYQLESL